MQFNFARPLAVAAAALVATLSVVTLQKAYASTTVANASKTTYTVGPNTVSPSFGIGSQNGPVFIMATQLTNGFRGVASATLAYSSESTPILSWTGINSYQNSATDASLASGYVYAGGSPTTILKVGWSGSSTLESALDGSSNPTRMVVRNTTGTVKTVVVTQIW